MLLLDCHMQVAGFIRDSFITSETITASAHYNVEFKNTHLKVSKKQIMWVSNKNIPLDDNAKLLSLTKAVRQLENSKKSETLQKYISTDAKNVTIFCVGNETVLRVKTPPRRNREFSFYRKYFRNRKSYWKKKLNSTLYGFWYPIRWW